MADEFTTTYWKPSGAERVRIMSASVQCTIAMSLLCVLPIAQELQRDGAKMIIVVSTAGPVRENEFIVLDASHDSILWTAIGADGRILGEGRSPDTSHGLRKAFNDATVRRQQMAERPGATTQPTGYYVSLLYFGADGVRTCTLSSTQEHMALVWGDNLRPTFDALRKSVHGKRYYLPRVLTTGQLNDQLGDVASPDAVAKAKERPLKGEIPPRRK